MSCVPLPNGWICSKCTNRFIQTMCLPAIGAFRLRTFRSTAKAVWICRLPSCLKSPKRATDNRLKSLYLWITTKHGRAIRKAWKTFISKRPKKEFAMRWPPMPAGAGGLKGVTTNSEHFMLRIIYIMLIYVPWYSNKQLYSKILDSPLSLLLPYQPIKIIKAVWKLSFRKWRGSRSNNFGRCRKSSRCLHQKQPSLTSGIGTSW